MPDNVHFRVAIVGAGSAGISVAARLIRADKGLRRHVALIDSARKHYYQPLWTLVGGGAVKRETTEKDQSALIPDGVEWLQESVVSFHPDEQYVMTNQKRRVNYDYLVVACGIEIDWSRIKGLREAIGRDGVCSNYSYDYVESTWQSIRDFQGGTAIFTHPNTPVKCGGAPQKIMYLAEEHFVRAGVRERSKVVFASANASIFSVKKYADTLTEVIRRKQIDTMYRHHLTEIRSTAKEAVFEQLDTKASVTLAYDMIHVTPPMQAPHCIRNSPLSDSAGWVDVDRHTLQHKRYKRIFSLGDCSNLPTSKTGAAIRKQTPVVVQNLLAVMSHRPLSASYDGYTSCPLVTGYGRLVLAEFDYELTPRETFPFDQSKERYSMYLFKKNVLPLIYWKGMLKGFL